MGDGARGVIYNTPFFQKQGLRPYTCYKAALIKCYEVRSYIAIAIAIQLNGKTIRGY